MGGHVTLTAVSGRATLTAVSGHVTLTVSLYPECSVSSEEINQLCPSEVDIG